MSKTLNLTCEQCRETLWVGQFSNSLAGWYLYAHGPRMAALNAFVNKHAEHGVKFEDSERVNIDYNDVTDYGEDR